MSEKMYALLLRLYPSRFREAYGEEAIQLFRDRTRDEHGLFRGMRLWWDLLVDLMVSLPREYRHLRPALAGTTQVRLEGAPWFEVLEDESPRPVAWCFGGVLALAALSVFAVLLTQPGDRGRWRESGRRNVAAQEAQTSTSGGAAGRDGGSAAGEPTASGTAQSHGLQPMKQRSAMAPADGASVDAAERHRVINAAAADLERYYFDHEVAQKTVAALEAHEQSGDDNSATEGEAFAALLTAQMRGASHDMHLTMEYSQNPLPLAPPVQTAEAQARFREAMLQQHCMIRKAEVLPHDIGYLKLDFFADAAVCGDKVRAAMASLNQADAVIFDLRDNAGGFPETVSLVASYLFDHPEYMYGPRGAPTADSWTHSPVAGNRLADKPVYVLTSRSTWSGAEQFSYDLKMMKRATLVGQTTRGGTHAGVFHRIDDHFGMGIPEERSINPYGKADWEGVGVQPDVPVKAADALDTAEKLAEAKLGQK